MLPDRPLKIEVRLPSSHPQLLEGLDTWLRLGLISDAQVRQLCREFLTCPAALQPQRQVIVANSDFVAQLPIEALAFNSPKKAPAKPAEPNLVAKMLQSLGAELSVRWLLFLGVFLVVVSSGVLAASQWERFPASGQYAVLLAYTLSFWGFSFWAGRQNNLTLTAQTLLIVTLLLVPVNFWAMDSFKLWQNPLDWLTVAIASPILTAITVLIYKNRLFFANFRTGKLLLVNILGLSYLQWGWKLFPGFPLIAVYVAMVGTTIITIYHNRHRQVNPPIPTENQGDRQIGIGINLPAAVIVYALLVLLVRAIFVVQIDVTQLGLAIGLCGWLMTWLAQQENSSPPSPVTLSGAEGHPPSLSSPFIWERFGSVLLLLGWLVAVTNYPWQAIAVSGLSLWYVGDRLRRYSLNIDLAAGFLIGLQTVWLAWRCLPAGLQASAIALGTQLTQAQDEPWALLSVAYFPYIILLVTLTESWRRVQKRELAKFGELLTLSLGVVLTTISLVNPVLRSLNLLFSTLTLAFVTQRRAYQYTTTQGRGNLAPTYPLIYLTHITGVLTLCSIINWLLPNLTNGAWASILLALMVAEWAFSLRDGLWRDSAWYIGLGLAVVSFLLLWARAELAWYGNVNTQYNLGVIWLITPLALTGIASRTAQRRRMSSFLSVLAVGLAQLLTLPLPGIRLIGLAVAAGLMLANTRYLRHIASAVITESFVLGFVGVLLWEGVPGLPRLALAGWFVVGAIATLSLWLGRTALLRRGDELATIYADASDKWAIALSVFELLALTLHSLAVYNTFTSPGFLYLIATAITLAAITYRSWQQPTNWAFYGVGWCVELLIAELLGFWGRSIVNMAIANITLGLITQLLGEWWRRKYQLERLPSSLHILPLIYGAFSILLRFNTFTDWTGFCSLGVALIVIGVGRRREEFKPLLYLGIIGVSVSAYELLFYQMSLATGGAYGDALIAMSALGVGIMYAYQILSPWLVDYLRLTPQQLKAIAHIHWAWSSFLLLVAISAPIAANRLVGLGTGIFLIQYAIFQGRRLTGSTVIFGRITIAEMWVYLGLLGVAAIRVYWRETAVGQFFDGPLMPWKGAIACVIAYFLYILPWENWGWSKKPWQQAAYIVPLIISYETRLQIYPITLLIVAGFYIFLAKMAGNIRFTYLSVALVNWALFRWFDSLHLTDALWYVTPIGLSILYVAQIDPQLKLAENKIARHSLRLFGSSLICGWAILFHQDTALIPGIFSLIAIFAGLALRVRAFLYVGTAAFFITSIYQLIIFSLRYPFLKWIIGLLVGIVLISIAANFETRRTQITSLLRNTNNEFQEWE
ncbi:hypothetical protein [Calothrix sp. PCC 7507]|uniref:hypothetical protein n=1 Tax=Calothrix sp. PCC 7507 TaxID=99598 RepID=UPI00029F2D38|nr:hypothetical protein [Calothrix sp. PCC 7507]AFY32745.1 hypothetical protein Cal7507_2312 [Calothrix sp. PCC 7507]